MIKLATKNRSEINIRTVPITRYRATQAVLLVCLAVGMLWSNVLLVRLMGYPATPSFFLTIPLLMLGLYDTLCKVRLPRAVPFLAALALLMYELIIHGVIMGHIAHSEWIKSFSLLTMCAGLLILSSKFKIYEHQLPALSNAVSYLAYLMGGLGFLQFILSNIVGITWIPVPASWSLRNMVDLGTKEATRFAGLTRAYGLAYEPSYYGTGMVVLTTLCLTLLYLHPPIRRARLFRWGALLIALGGVVLSVSIAAWGFMAVVLLAWFLGRFRLRGLLLKIKLIGTPYQRKLIKRFVLLGLVLLPFITAGLWPYMQNRVNTILQGADRSTNSRVIMSVVLLVSPGEDIAYSLLGTGIGLEGQSSRARTALTTYGYGDPERAVTMWNGYAYIATTMGWIGLILQGLIIAGALHQKGILPIPTLHLSALVVFYLVAHGVYLSPEWWALLILVTSIKNLRLTP